jgi:uncharacterized protein (TIGR02246 family)
MPGIADELIAGFASAWNAHDMDPLATFFHEDGTFVNVVGSYERAGKRSGNHPRPFTPVSMRTRFCVPRSWTRGNWCPA